MSSLVGVKFEHFYAPFPSCLEASLRVAAFSALLQVKYQLLKQAGKSISLMENLVISS